MKRDRFEEFEKKCISDSNNNNNNKQTFKTASAYQLAVKNNGNWGTAEREKLGYFSIMKYFGFMFLTRSVPYGRLRYLILQNVLQDTQRLAQRGSNIHLCSRCPIGAPLWESK